MTFVRSRWRLVLARTSFEAVPSANRASPRAASRCPLYPVLPKSFLRLVVPSRRRSCRRSSVSSGAAAGPSRRRMPGWVISSVTFAIRGACPVSAAAWRPPALCGAGPLDEVAGQVAEQVVAGHRADVRRPRRVTQRVAARSRSRSRLLGVAGQRAFLPCAARSQRTRPGDPFRVALCSARFLLAALELLPRRAAARASLARIGRLLIAPVSTRTATACSVVLARAGGARRARRSGPAAPSGRTRSRTGRRVRDLGQRGLRSPGARVRRPAPVEASTRALPSGAPGPARGPRGPRRPAAARTRSRTRPVLSRPSELFHHWPPA